MADAGSNSDALSDPCTQLFFLKFENSLVLLTNYIYGGCSLTYPVAAIMLLGMASWTALTGGRTLDAFLKMSPVVEKLSRY